MLTVFNRYQISNDIQMIIYEYLKDKYRYDLVVKEIPRGIHRSYVTGEVGCRKAYDIFKKKLKKNSIVVKLTDLYEFDITTHCPFFEMSQSAPIYVCKICKKYHKVNYYGERYCSTLGIYI